MSEKNRVITELDSAFPVPPHTYLSTACLHEAHEQCRQTCKFCSAKCVCGCHTIETP
jgi:hypothetical protein